MAEKILWKQLGEQPVEEMVTVTMPKSSWEAFHCMEDYPIVGYHDRDELAMGRRDWHKTLYPLPEAFKRRQDVPHGSIVGHVMEDSAFYPGVKHKYWIYTPAQYDGSTPADLILFLDGDSHMLPAATAPVVPADGIRVTKSDTILAAPVGEITLPDTGEHVTDLLDNLIADGKIPVTIGVFITPGYPGPGEPVYGTGKGITNRSVEYDTVSDWNARFLAEEFLPMALKDYAITADPAGHSTFGISSSGIAAFAAAWYANHLFGNAILGSPSFGNIRGGNIWPSVVRTTDEKKALKTCICVGKYDADIIFGDWVLANRDMASALNYKDYDFRLMINEMGHSMHFLKYMLPQALAWIYHGEEVCDHGCEVVKPYPLVTEEPEI